MIGQAGKEKSDDIMVQVKLDSCEEIKIDLESKVKQLFGKQIEKSIKEVLKEMGVKGAHIIAKDQGALDFIIRARVKTAVRRAREVSNNEKIKKNNDVLSSQQPQNVVQCTNI